MISTGDVSHSHFQSGTTCNQTKLSDAGSRCKIRHARDICALMQQAHQVYACFIAATSGSGFVRIHGLQIQGYVQIMPSQTPTPSPGMLQAGDNQT